MKQTSKQPTRVAVLGTLAEFGDDPIPYDLPALVDLVRGIQPDLLCLDITPAQWQAQDFAALPPEYSAALLPLARQSDMVVAPIGRERPAGRPVEGWRELLIAGLRRIIGWLQRTAPNPAAVNEGWRHDWGNLLYGLTRRLAGPPAEAAYHEQIQALTAAVLDVARHNPGDRILVVTNIQYCHHIRPQLSEDGSVVVTSYQEL